MCLVIERNSVAVRLQAGSYTVTGTGGDQIQCVGFGSPAILLATLAGLGGNSCIR